MIKPIKFLKEKCNNFKEAVLEKWDDPVWSKVISNAIWYGPIFIITVIILPFLYFLYKMLFEKIPYSDVLEDVLYYFGQTTEINNLIIWFVGLTMLIIFVSVIKIYKSQIKYLFFILVRKKEKTEPKSTELERIGLSSTVHFSYRIGDAFPGHRDLQWYNSIIAVERLKILFKMPLRYKSEAHGTVGDPIWWFRGGSDGFIDNFIILSKTKVLLSHYELVIKRIAVHVDQSYSRHYIYVEASAEKQTGIYDISKENIESHIQEYGYCSEEFALLNKTPIKREEFDDGSAVIGGKVVDAMNSKLRTRYLSDYNFLIAAKQSPYNMKSRRKEIRDIFDNILKGKSQPEDLFQFLETVQMENIWD